MTSKNKHTQCPACFKYANIAKKAFDTVGHNNKPTNKLGNLIFDNKTKKISPVCLSAVAGVFTSIISERSKRVEAVRREKERQLARERCRSSRNIILAGAGGAVAGVAAGYLCARTLQLTGKYGNPDNDIYTKNPQLSDYAPCPAPKISKKEYMPFNGNVQISIDGTTLLAKA